MFKLIEGLPPDVLAIEASGQVTYEDYRDMLDSQGRGDDDQGPDPDAVPHRRGFHRV